MINVCITCICVFIQHLSLYIYKYSTNRFFSTWIVYTVHDYQLSFCECMYV